MQPAHLAQHHLHSASELLSTILGSSRPADKEMELFFRRHKELGLRDRGVVAEAVYGVLRRLRSLLYALEPGRAWPAEVSFPAEGSERKALCTRLVVAQLVTGGGLSTRELLRRGLREELETAAHTARAARPESFPPPVRAELPSWLFDRLAAGLGEAGALALGQAFSRAAPVDLRVNTLKAKRDEVSARLAEEGFPSTPTPWSPHGLRRQDHAPLFRTRAFQDGLFEIQDEGSQLVTFLVEPRRKERVADFCAGGGGKTLELAALMANTGTIYAFDTSAARLDRMRPRLARAGVDTVRVMHLENERDKTVRRLEGKLDRVLVDAPCSGTGTLRRSPDLKWRPCAVEELVARQTRILAAAATLVRPGGRLVYATCSVLREENDGVVEAFLAAAPDFALVPAAEILARRQIPLSLAEPVLRLTPLAHQTDAFFAAALERRGGQAADEPPQPAGSSEPESA
ncbi:MAG: RsmB/NOP family class I SAM-dependent RNA methyltransferase [Deltaproteobacteria bacterium]|nr:RsmB/NOP family class I SAM-dependent RNA methyltransferase [Deltaproteobacteria bacterium]